jgi:hypothetical protein
MTDVDFDPQYNAMNAGAHRRPPPGISAPALVWQRGFWRPSTVTLNDWTAAIDGAMAHLFLHLRQDAALRKEGAFQPPVSFSPDTQTAEPPKLKSAIKWDFVCSNLERDSNVPHKTGDTERETVFCSETKWSLSVKVVLRGPYCAANKTNI